MIQEALNFAQTKPLTTGLIVIGVGALGYFALAGGGSSDSATLDNSGSGLLYTRPSDAEIAAASSIADSQIRAQRESEDSQIAAVLGSKTLDFQYDLTKQRQNNELAKINGEVAVAQRSYDVALATTATQAEVAKYNADAAYKSLTYTTDAAYKTMVYNNDTAFNLQQNQNWADYDSLKYDNDTAVTLTNANNTASIEATRIQGDAAVRAARASRNRGFSIGIPGIGSFGISL